MGISPQQFHEMEQRLAKDRTVRKPAAVPALIVSQKASSLPMLFTFPDEYNTKEFVFNGNPIGKPRMTNRDRFKKRPCVQRYWEFKDALRRAAGFLPKLPDMVIVTAWVPVPPSWSKKKKNLKIGHPCRQKPDWDNIGKAVCDALFDEDACIWTGITVKYWCQEGQERLNVKILYAKP